MRHVDRTRPLLLLSLALSAALAGCGGSDSGAATTTADTEAESVRDWSDRLHALAVGDPWVKVADEWTSFTLTRSQTVRYGAGTVWIERTAPAGAVPCTNAFFGPDPAVGITKQCQVRQGTSPTPTPTPTPTPAPTPTPSPAPSGSPVIYVNDQPNDVYTDPYIYALASNGEINLRGLVSSGVDCNCSAGDNYPRTDTPAKRQKWINDARAAGFRNLPDNTNGTQGAKLSRPSSGVPRDTRPIGSAGTNLIVSEALRATPSQPLVLIVAGPITTVADAYASNPSIADRVVVYWLAGSRDNDRDAFGDWNGSGDAWATEVVLRSLKTYMFPVLRDPPLVSGAGFRAQLPAGAFLNDFADGAYYCKINLGQDADCDGQPAAAFAMGDRYAPAQNYSRRSFVNGRLQDDANGKVYMNLRGDGAAAGQDYYRALRKAYGR